MFMMRFNHVRAIVTLVEVGVDIQAHALEWRCFQRDYPF